MAPLETSRRLRKKNNTHKALLHAAKKLFEEKGLGNVTIDEISEAADVSRSTFFTHFNSLDDLMEQIAAEEINDLVSVFEESEQEVSISALIDKLVDDTIPYPYLTGNLLMRGILCKGESSFSKIYDMATERIKTHAAYAKLLETFTPGNFRHISSAHISELFFNASSKTNPLTTLKSNSQSINLLTT